MEKVLIEIKIGDTIEYRKYIQVAQESTKYFLQAMDIMVDSFSQNEKGEMIWDKK